MRKLKAIIIGDTRYFHIGSRTNCSYLLRYLKEKYALLGIFGGDNFVFDTYGKFMYKLKDYKNLYKNLLKSDVIFLNGEGYLEPNSNHAEAIFFLAKYVNETWPMKKLILINFSCFDKKYGDWNLFDALIPRERKTFHLLKSQHRNVKLGFDCSILQKDKHLPIVKKNNILIFRGRRDFTDEEINKIGKNFMTKETILCSAFWKFKNRPHKQVASIAQLQALIRQSHLIISSSFHGIIFSIRFGIPFIPIDTIGTDKNAAVSADVLGRYFKKRTLKEWLVFYNDRKKYYAIKNRLKTVLPNLQKRAIRYQTF